jgi:2-polyprenyl-3-methyl-5-hydroxy-6-metoxy-1,4-benzoquinol methylase
LWEKGDFTEIAAFMRQSVKAIIQSIGITPPLVVLDLGCGTGTTAIPLARLGPKVVGIDIARNLVEAATACRGGGPHRTEVSEGTRVIWRRRDRSFDLVVSMFGAMFAPSPSMSPRRWCA